MKNNKENLEGIVSKLKKQGINAGEEEKQHIIENAKKHAEMLINEAETLKENIIEEAKIKAKQTEKNALTSIKQASRDMVEATKIAMLQYLKLVFREQCESLFTQKQYLQELTKAVVESISGNKIVAVPAEMQKDMNAFLLKEALKEQVILKPLSGSDAKIEVKSTEKKNIQFVLSAKDVEDGLFSLLNKDLVERITKKPEA
ncbi:MAG: hypothetical protein COC06_01580 [Bacteroidales bacterium]|nr:MAG: hypothetical protein COC06_12645 [Bacteroidales bacterium]PCH71352.1 MAG: hypothetical protein COC06_01580 [Bacteroidales bacterium]